MPSAVHLNQLNFLDSLSQIEKKYPFIQLKVILTYPACDEKDKATFGGYLQTLTYKHIADAVFRCPSLKSSLITKSLEALCRECTYF